MSLIEIGRKDLKCPRCKGTLVSVGIRKYKCIVCGREFKDI